MSWDKDYRQVYIKRLRALKTIRADKTGKVLAALKVFYKTHPVEFIQDWMVTYDPRQPKPYMPFTLFDIQKDYCHFLTELVEERESGMVEKSRDGGFTWVSCAWATHRWLFFDGFAAGFGSRKEDLVDRLGVSDSIMEKIRIILRNLPVEFRPKGYKEKQHAGHLKILNPENGASMIGEAGDNIGRGGRTSIYFKDESAHYERPEKIEAALSENTECQVDISSVNGEGNVFHKRRLAGKVWKHGEKIPSGYTRVFIHDWRDDPRKDQAWYDKKKSKASREGLDHIFAQEVDRDYAAAVKGVFIPAKWVKAAIDFVEHGEGIKQLGLDPDDEGADGKALVYRHGIKTEWCKFWHEGNTTETAQLARQEAIMLGVDELVFDATGVGAGIKGELNRLDKDPDSPFLSYQGVHNASTTLPGFYEGTDKLNKDLFTNIRAKDMWNLRRRFEKTYERIAGIFEHPIDECISIPNDPDLISEISRPKRVTGAAGKISMESREQMKTRGITSPNRLMALGLAYHDTGEHQYYEGAA